MIDAAGLAWTVEQHPFEAVLSDRGGGEPTRVPVPRVVANMRSDTSAVLGVVGEGYEPLQNRAAFAFCDAITDSGEAHWLGGGETRGGARVHALMRLDREIRIGDALSGLTPRRFQANSQATPSKMWLAPTMAKSYAQAKETKLTCPAS